MTPESRPIKGACHCGNIRFDLTWPDGAPEIPVRKCGCTFCRKHGGAWTSHTGSSLDVELGNPALVSKYRFGTGTADFYVCSGCGVVPFVVSEIDGVLYAVVNVNTFENAQDYAFSSSASDFDGEDTGSRLDRRQRNWIPRIRITAGS